MRQALPHRRTTHNGRDKHGERGYDVGTASQPKLVRGLLPGVTSLRGYQRAWLRSDLLAGVAVAAYLVPQVMAYAEIAGLPVATGLVAMCGALASYAVLGSSRQLSVGPESTTALLTAATVAPLAGGDPVRYAALASGLAIVVGVLCLLGRLARAGALADLLSKPVLVGYLAGIAILMITSQLRQLTGVAVDGNSMVSEITSFVTGLNQVHVPTVTLSTALLAVLLVGQRLWPRWPILLIGMLAATGAVAVFSLQQYGIVVIGQSATGIPVLAAPHLSTTDLQALALPALGIAVVAYSDNMLTARAFAGRRSQSVDGNTELIALGVANMVSGLLHCFPVSSSGSRTAIGDAQGSRTQLHSLVALVLVLVVLVVGGTLLAGFPAAALGAVVVYAALQLIDLPEFIRIARFRRAELLLALTATSGVLVLGVLYGVLVAVGLSIMELLRRLARPHDGILGYAPGVPGMHDVDDYPDARQIPGLIVYRYDAPLCFANAEDFRRRALAAAASAASPLRWFLLNTEANVEVDSTAADALAALHTELRRQGVVFAMARVKQDLRDQLAKTDLIDTIGQDRIFMTLPTAVTAYRNWHQQQFGSVPDGPQP